MSCAGTALRQMGESSVLGSLSGSLTASLNEVLRWVYWWHSTEESPADVGPEQIHYELSADFDTSLMDAEDVTALVAAWQMGAISRDTLLHNFRQGEILPPGRTNEREVERIEAEGGSQRSEDKRLQQAEFLRTLACGHSAARGIFPTEANEGNEGQ